MQRPAPGDRQAEQGAERQAGSARLASRVAGTGPVLSVVAPAHNEQDNIAELVRQVGAALGPLGL
ncbi:MAG TPA: hypothetical protein VD963_05935, partial [Phycisphaerales bacterium]|nr:hypothetical protein [Phycisphaerales bacterium]